MIGKMTETGKQKMCKAHAGDAALPKIVTMAFGDGGVDDSGAPLPVTGEETALKNSLLTKAIASHEFPDTVSVTFHCKLTKAELAEKYISEIGLIDNEGDLVAYRTMRSMGKDDDMEITFSITETFSEVE